MDRQAIRRFAHSANREERRRADELLMSSSVMKPGVAFITGTGKKNSVIMRDEKSVYIKAAEGNKLVRVPLNKIKSMVAYFLRIRIIERKEVEVFHAYSSAILGLLQAIFEGKAKVNKCGNLLRLILMGIRMYLAGFERSPGDLGMAVMNGARYVLASFFYTRQSTKWRQMVKQYGLRLILDCGQFSTWSAVLKGKRFIPGPILEYCSFIIENEIYIDHYFAYDEIGDWKKTMDNLQYMENFGLNPIPIFHLGTPFEVLDCLVERGYPVIALGGTVNKSAAEVDLFLEKVFALYPTQAFHGLGISRAAFLRKYPFFSCDSKSWITVRWREVILREDRQEYTPEIPFGERMRESMAYWLGLEEPTNIAV